MDDSDHDAQGHQRSRTRSRSRPSLRTSDMSVSSAGKPDGTPDADPDTSSDSDSDSDTSSSESGKRNNKLLKLKAVTEEDAYELEHNMIHTERIQKSVTGLSNQQYSCTLDHVFSNVLSFGGTNLDSVVHSSWFIMCKEQAQVMHQGWPAGPTSLDDLFRWASFNARTVLLNCETADDNRTRFRNLMKYPIQIFDSYSGTGTASSTLHTQYKHMVRTLVFTTWEGQDSGVK